MARALQATAEVVTDQTDSEQGRAPQELREPLPPSVTYGVCFCGALRVQVSSEPVVRALCHCAARAARG